MNVDSSKLETVFEQKRLECKLDQVPCTVQTTYSNLDGKQDHLLRRELKLLDSKRVIIGVEYDEQGNPAEVYTENKDGKRVKLSISQEARPQTLPNLIEERLKVVSKALNKPPLENTSSKEETKTPKAPKRKLLKATKEFFTNTQKRA